MSSLLKPSRSIRYEIIRRLVSLATVFVSARETILPRIEQNDIFFRARKANAKKARMEKPVQSIFLLFAMFDIVFWEGFLLDTKQLFCHLQVNFSLKSSSLASEKRKIIGKLTE